MSEKNDQITNADIPMPVCGCYLGMFGCECPSCQCTPQQKPIVTPPTSSGLSIDILVRPSNPTSNTFLAKDEQADFSLGMYGLLYVCNVLEKEGRLK